MIEPNNSTNKSVESMITNIVTVVFRIHFYYINNPDLEDDLKQEGYLKAYELLAQGNYDPNKNLRTFIYTGVRNAMTNFMYHQNKETHLDADAITSQSWQSYERITMDDFWRGKIFYTNDDITSDVKLDIDNVINTCDKYIMFGDYQEVILNELFDLGLIKLNRKFKINFEPIQIVKDTILGEIFWNMFKNN